LVRKLAHLSEYALFSLLLYHSFELRHPERWNTRAAFGALLIAGLFSLGDEYHQSFVPGRTASLVDCAIDTAGALLALVLLYGGRRLQASHSSIAAENESKADAKKGTVRE
jgi:VanZ family protein